MRSKILLQVPAYGMEQLLVNSSDHGIGKPTEREYAIIGQAEVGDRNLISLILLSTSYMDVEWK